LNEISTSQVFPSIGKKLIEVAGETEVEGELCFA
jgi:hypothetical protein